MKLSNLINDSMWVGKISCREEVKNCGREREKIKKEKCIRREGKGKEGEKQQRINLPSEFQYWSARTYKPLGGRYHSTTYSWLLLLPECTAPPWNCFGQFRETLAAHRNPKKYGEVPIFFFFSLPAILKQNLLKESEICLISSACMFQRPSRILPFSSSIWGSSSGFHFVFLGHVFMKNKKALRKCQSAIKEEWKILYTRFS